MKSLRNIPIGDFRKTLSALGCSFKRTKGGHEAWWKNGLSRPIIFQNHIDPVPEIVIRNAIRDLGITKQELLNAYESI